MKKQQELHKDTRSHKQRLNAKRTLEAWSRLGLLFTPPRSQKGTTFEERKLTEQQ